MPKLSAGILLHRHHGGVLEVLLAHPGGPFWSRKDDGAWSIPKGEYDSGDDPWEVAQREFLEELGTPAPAGERLDLGDTRQAGGKVVRAFAVAGDLDIVGFHSNTFTIEWPKGSGRLCEFPEIDRVSWLPITDARVKILKGQVVFLDRLLAAAEVVDGHAPRPA